MRPSLAKPAQHRLAASQAEAGSGWPILSVGCYLPDFPVLNSQFSSGKTFKPE